MHISSQHQAWPDCVKLPVLEISPIWHTAILTQTARWQQNALLQKPRKDGVFPLTTLELRFYLNLFSLHLVIYKSIFTNHDNLVHFSSLSPTFFHSSSFFHNFQLCQLSYAPYSRFPHVPSCHRQQVYVNSSQPELHHSLFSSIPNHIPFSLPF